MINNEKNKKKYSNNPVLEVMMPLDTHVASLLLLLVLLLLLPIALFFLNSPPPSPPSLPPLHNLPHLYHPIHSEIPRNSQQITNYTHSSQVPGCKCHLCLQHRNDNLNETPLNCSTCQNCLTCRPLILAFNRLPYNYRGCFVRSKVENIDGRKRNLGLVCGL